MLYNGNKKGLFQKMAGLFENWLNFLHELAGKLGQDLATLMGR